MSDEKGTKKKAPAKELRDALETAKKERDEARKERDDARSGLEFLTPAERTEHDKRAESIRKAEADAEKACADMARFVVPDKKSNFERALRSFRSAVEKAALEKYFVDSLFVMPAKRRRQAFIAASVKGTPPAAFYDPNEARRSPPPPPGQFHR